MKSLKWFLPVAAISATLGCLSLVGQVSADEDKDQGEQKGRRRVVVIEEEPGDEDVIIRRQPGEERVIRRRERGVPVSRYMLGIRCEQDDAGVFVDDVLEDMPAEKAGVKAEDRITKIDDTEIKDVKALIDTVQNSDGKDLKLTIKRGDEELSISVAPVRQETADLEVEFSERGDGDFFRRFLPFQDDRLFRFHPGFVFGEHEKLGEFPKNVSISINRSNDGPANITVERDGKKWTVDEKTIDQLPEDLRAWARRMLAASNGDMLMPEIRRLPEQFVVPGPRRGIRGDRLIPRAPQAPDHDEDLDELKKEVQKLREMVEKLQEKE